MGWVIVNMTRNTSGPQKDGVIEVTADYKMTEGQHTVSHPIFAKFTPDKDKDGYVAWDNLTPEIVGSWMDDYVDLENVKALLTATLANEKSKISELPWE
jgi:hypothetical protein